MVTVQLKGVHVVKAKGREYHYAWRGGPRLSGAPGSPEYVAAYSAAHAERKAPQAGTVEALVARFKASVEYTRLGAHTQRAYRLHLDAITKRWGAAPVAILDDPKVRKRFIEWRDTMADRPRTADMAMGVLKVLLSWAEERVIIHSNQAKPIRRLHRVDKSDAIWTADDLKAFLAKASPEMAWAVELALHTGLRQSDLIRLAWTHREGSSFTYRTSKRGKHVTIPITPGCEALLGRIERRGPVILTTGKTKRPWTADGLRASFAEVCKGAGVARTFHDLRRTAATNLLSAGLDSSQVAMLMGWAEDDVEAMKRKYVSRSAVVAAVLAKLEKGR